MSVRRRVLARPPRICFKRRMTFRLRFLLAILLPLAVAACGDLPAPFMGHPGANARRLLEPLTPMLAVPAPTEALLTDAASETLASDLATNLADAEVPALARAPQRNDWRLITRAESRGGNVVPIFVVQDPQGKEQGSVEGNPVPASAWAVADPATLRKAAEEGGARVSTLLTSIRVSRDRADPNSLYNRPAKVMVADVTGAPGDGNLALTRQMRAQLGNLGPVVQTSPGGADYIVRCEVKVVAIPGRQQRVEIQWIIATAAGDERGRVIQLNEIPAGTLDRFWGDVAVVVVNEAAPGINDVLVRNSGRDPNEGKQRVPIAVPDGAQPPDAAHGAPAASATRPASAAAPPPPGPARR